MKKTIITICAVLGLALAGHAQDAFQQHDKVVNIGVGLFNTRYADGHFVNKIPPISASFEYCIIDHVFDDKSGIGVGGVFGFTGAEHQIASAGNARYGWRYRDYLVAARGAFHYQPVRGMDTYVGFVSGYNILTSKRFGADVWPGEVNVEADEPYFVFGGILGIRYYFSDSFGVMAEAGTSLSYLTVGVALRF